jgi:hypothetical protein
MNTDNYKKPLPGERRGTRPDRPPVGNHAAGA